MKEIPTGEGSLYQCEECGEITPGIPITIRRRETNEWEGYCGVCYGEFMAKHVPRVWQLLDKVEQQ